MPISQQTTQNQIKLVCPSKFLHCSSNPLWKKSKNFDNLLMDKVNKEKKVEFFKYGKTFQKQTVRFISYYHKRLYYFETSLSQQCLGYCQTSDMYCKFQNYHPDQTIILNNGLQQTQIHFKDQHDFQFIKNKIIKDVIQIDFDLQYDKIRKIGCGATAEIYQVNKKNVKEKFAAKIINKMNNIKNKALTSIDEEKIILTKLNSELIEVFFQCYENQQEYILILQYVSGDTLDKIIERKDKINYEEKLWILHQFLEGLAYIHSRKIIHRDIKPQNIIVNLKTSTFKIIDFGLALNLSFGVQSDAFVRCGTYGYMAPEVIHNNEYCIAYNQKCDIFGFGLISHMILIGFNPLKGKSYQQTYCKNRECNLQLNEKQIVSQYGRNCLIFIMHLLDKNAQARYSAIQALKTRFLNEKCTSESTYGGHEEIQQKIEDLEQFKVNSKSPNSLKGKKQYLMDKNSHHTMVSYE